MSTAKFGLGMEELVDRYRSEVQAEADRIRSMGRLTSPEVAETFGERVERALSYIALKAPLRPCPVPPAFTELRIAAIESLYDRKLLDAAEASLDRIERRVAALFKQEYPALGGVGLGIDDLMEMARMGFCLRERFHREARKIVDGAKGSFVERVRSRKLAGEAERLRDDANDVNPRNVHATRRAIALMALEAAKERTSGLPMGLDPSLPRGYAPIPASAFHLMKLAAELSEYLLPAEREELRMEIAKAGRKIELASDIEEARRLRDETGLSLPWMAQA